MLSTGAGTFSREAKVVQMFISVDPLAEKYASYSTYTYTLNNPVFFIDPDGMQVEHDYQLLKNGQVKLIKETTDKSDTLYASNNDGSVNKNKSVTVQKRKASDSSKKKS